MELKKMIYLMIVLLITSNCKNDKIKSENRVSKDLFYTESSINDYIRFPLIKPYEVISLDDGETWNVDIKVKPKSILEINNPNNVKNVSVVNDLIMLHSIGQTIVKGEEVVEGWYVIIPVKSIIESFKKEEEFLIFIKKEKIERIEWETSKELFEQFDRTYCLSWIKDCK